MADGATVSTALDLAAIRAQFPILSRQVNGRPLVYLDNAASAQKPRAVIDTLVGMMEHGYSNVHRGLHTLSNEATEAYENAREIVARLHQRKVGHSQQLDLLHQPNFLRSAGATCSPNSLRKRD